MACQAALLGEGRRGRGRAQGEREEGRRPHAPHGSLRPGGGRSWGRRLQPRGGRFVQASDGPPSTWCWQSLTDASDGPLAGRPHAEEELLTHVLLFR